MAKVKVINNTTTLDSNLNGLTFNNVTSNTIFSFGSFNVTSNFDGRNVIDYKTKLNSFSKPVSLDSLNLTDKQSKLLTKKSKEITLNLDKSNLKSFIRYGSGYEFLRGSIENIIVNYPGSLYLRSDGNSTFRNYTYNPITDTCKFEVICSKCVNKFGLIYDANNNTVPDNNTIKNLNLSYSDYIVWVPNKSNVYNHNIVGFTGTTNNNNYILIEVSGNVFNKLKDGIDYGSFDYHIRPNTVVFEEFRTDLNYYEKYILSNRNSNGFVFQIKDPTLLDSGEVTYSTIN
ncbi:MAG: hypothetical protein ACOC2W_02790, partial [bacterium]